MGGTWIKVIWTPINVGVAYPTMTNNMEGMENCVGISHATWIYRE
jgi:hypothetical protein